jgi:hypothetical protein
VRVGLIKVTKTAIDEVGAELMAKLFLDIGFFPIDIKWSPPFCAGEENVAVYMGLSDSFKPVYQDNPVPEYELIISTNKKGVLYARIKK